jgi:hypothetical protein
MIPPATTGSSSITITIVVVIIVVIIIASADPREESHPRTPRVTTTEPISVVRRSHRAAGMQPR